MKKKALKNFNHLKAEKKIYSDWEKKTLFSSKNKQKKFSIIMPPPKCNRSLPIGHALNMTIQDIICRYWRMNDREYCGNLELIMLGATQNIVKKPT